MAEKCSSFLAYVTASSVNIEHRMAAAVRCVMQLCLIFFIDDVTIKFVSNDLQVVDRTRIESTQNRKKKSQNIEIEVLMVINFVFIIIDSAI